MKRKKAVLLAALCLCAVIAFAGVTAAVWRTFQDDHGPAAFDKNNPETWFGETRNGGIKLEDAQRMEAGISFEEAVGMLGKPQRDVGSGAFLMEWDIASGGTLVVAFNHAAGSESAGDLVAYNVTIKEP